MKKEEKNQLIESLAEQISASNYMYITDISDLNSVDTSKLRRLCFKREIKLIVAKNTLLKRAMEKSGRDYTELFPVLKGSTSIMLADINNLPAKLIREFRATSPKPILKGAFVEESFYIGDNQLDMLINIKSKNELIGDIIGMLQSPVQNVMSALQSGGNNISGILKTLSERPE
ncbi:MAG: 50S ribosomal protein L10 [Bacteroidetes bacterium]|nr:50S ribosomal protein L10 [Bacteroidota bacterium]